MLISEAGLNGLDFLKLTDKCLHTTRVEVLPGLFIQHVQDVIVRPARFVTAF